VTRGAQRARAPHCSTNGRCRSARSASSTPEIPSDSTERALVSLQSSKGTLALAPVAGTYPMGRVNPTHPGSRKT